MSKLFILSQIVLAFVTTVTAGSVCPDFAVGLGALGRVPPQTNCTPGNCRLGSNGVSLYSAASFDKFSLGPSLRITVQTPVLIDSNCNIIATALESDGTFGDESASFSDGAQSTTDSTGKT